MTGLPVNCSQQYNVMPNKDKYQKICLDKNLNIVLDYHNSPSIF